MYKALKTQMTEILSELKRLESGAALSDETLANIRLIAEIMNGMKEETE